MVLPAKPVKNLKLDKGGSKMNNEHKIAEGVLSESGLTGNHLISSNPDSVYTGDGGTTKKIKNQNKNKKKSQKK